MTSLFMKLTGGNPTFPLEFKRAWKDMHHEIPIGKYVVSVIEAVSTMEKSAQGNYTFEVAVLRDNELIPLPKRFGGDTTYRTEKDTELSCLLRMVAKRDRDENA